MLNWTEPLELTAAERQEARKRAADDIERIQARLAKARRALESIAGESESERRFAERQNALIRIDSCGSGCDVRSCFLTTISREIRSMIWARLRSSVRISHIAFVSSRSDCR
jgi:hypothetical protein